MLELMANTVSGYCYNLGPYQASQPTFHIIEINNFHNNAEK